jgi:uncharacterized membrane protein YsdA (DUF1294 family)
MCSASEVDPIIFLAWYGAFCGVASLVTFVTYWLDKRAAIRDRRRVSERTLHTMELLGGWPGAYVAQRTFRHKTRKRSYQVVYWAIVVLHVAGVVWVCWPAAPR